jgi:pimeloyl-ACP methyl ester carboxylesterase
VSARVVTANGLEFGILEAGTGPLALCLHGFPDSAHTWRHLLPALADAGFHAVAPFMRGYAPTGIPEDGCFRSGALIADAVALHEALGGDERAVLVGHDWGAEAAYGAAAFAPDRWRRVVTLAIPPLGLEAGLFADYDQLKRFFYFSFFQSPLAEQIVAADDMRFLDRLWRDWSPGYDPSEDLARVKRSLRDPAHLSAAISYYRADNATSGASGPFAAEQAALAGVGPQPTLYLHGDRDGCIGVEFAAGAERRLAPGSSMRVIEGTGHCPHLERPAEVNDHIVTWVTA